jgi:hypothetical protein
MPIGELAGSSVVFIFLVPASELIFSDPIVRKSVTMAKLRKHIAAIPRPEFSNCLYFLNENAVAVILRIYITKLDINGEAVFIQG